MRRLRWLLLLAVLAVLLLPGALLLDWLRGCGPDPRDDLDRRARTHLDSAPGWHEEARDSQAVLDSLQAANVAARAQSAQIRATLNMLRHRKDSLAELVRLQTAALDSASVPEPARRLIVTMREELEACRLGDTAYERLIRTTEGALTRCEKRALILEGQRDRAHARLDRADSLLAAMVAANQRAGQFELGFFLLPKPPKWLAALVGCVGGAVLGYVATQTDEDRGLASVAGCGLAGTVSTVALPTD